MEYNKKVKSYPVMLIFTSIAGVIYSLIGNAIYNGLINKIPTVFVIGLYFLGLAVIVSATVFIINLLSGNLPNKSSSKLVLLGIVFMLIFGILFEFLYQLGGKITYSDPDSYIFVIDNSGSMADSDPNQQRISALKSIVQDKGSTFPYAVYSFNNSIQQVREMASASKGVFDTEIQPENGTAIKNALTKVYDDISSGKYQTGSNPRVLLLSDGAATDCSEFTINSVLKKYANSGITICTVGLGNADESMLKRIAEKTGGGYVHANSSQQLSEAIKLSIESQTDRDLLNVRYVKSLDWLYMVMRILFIFILGLIMGLIRTFISNERDQSKQLIISVITALIGSIAIELGLNLFGLPLLAARMIMCVCFALTIASKEKIIFENTDVFGEYHFDQNNDSATNHSLEGNDSEEDNSYYHLTM